MTSPPPLAFAKPAMPGDAVSVLVLAEDSSAMASKWPDVRDSYLPNLLQSIRATNPSVQVGPSPPPSRASHPLLLLQMEARWITTSAASPVPPQPIPDTAHARSVPELPLGQTGSTKHSPECITHAIRVLVLSSGPSRVRSRWASLALVCSDLPPEHHEASGPRRSHRATVSRHTQRHDSFVLRSMGRSRHRAHPGDPQTFISLFWPSLIGSTSNTSACTSYSTSALK